MATNAIESRAIASAIRVPCIALRSLSPRSVRYHPPPVRIFQILEFNQFNTGSVHQMFQAAAGLSERGHEVTIVSRPGEEIERRAREAGGAFAGLKMRSAFDLASAAALRRLIRQKKPDVIHVHKGIAHGLALAAMATAHVPAFVR